MIWRSDDFGRKALAFYSPRIKREFVVYGHSTAKNKECVCDSTWGDNHFWLEGEESILG
jgi:hypothetical protein